MDPPQAHYSTISEKLDLLRKTLDERAMSVVCHLPTFLYTADLTESLRQASVKEMLSSLEVAASLHPLKVVLHPSYLLGLGVFVAERVREYSLTSLRTIVEKAEQLGLCLCIENMFPRSNLFVEPADFAEVFRNFPTLKLTSGHRSC